MQYLYSVVGNPFFEPFVFVADTIRGTVSNPECLAVLRILLLVADSSVLRREAVVISTTGIDMTACGVIRRCLLPLADVLQSAGTHVYLSTTKLHRAMLMMVALVSELDTSERENQRCCVM